MTKTNVPNPQKENLKRLYSALTQPLFALLPKGKTTRAIRNLNKKSANTYRICRPPQSHEGATKQAQLVNTVFECAPEVLDGGVAEDLLMHLNESVAPRFKHRYADWLQNEDLFTSEQINECLNKYVIKRNNDQYLDVLLDAWENRSDTKRLILDQAVGLAAEYNRSQLYEKLIQYDIKQVRQYSDNDNAPHPQVVAFTSIIEQGRKEHFDILLNYYPSSPKNGAFSYDRDGPDIPDIIIANIRLAAQSSRPEMVIDLIDHFKVKESNFLTNISAMLRRNGCLTDDQEARLTARAV